MLAGAFAAMMKSLESRRCYTCGQQGHLSYECNKGQGRWQSGPQGGRMPGMCPRCRKGRHYANQCQSCFDKDGNPINQQQGEFQCKAAQSL